MILITDAYRKNAFVMTYSLSHTGVVKTRPRYSGPHSIFFLWQETKATKDEDGFRLVYDVNCIIPLCFTHIFNAHIFLSHVSNDICFQETCFLGIERTSALL